MSVTTGEVATFFLGALAVFFSQYLTYWFRRKSESEVDAENAKRAAARVSTSLDDFAYRCAEVLSGNELDEQSLGHAGTAHYSIPNVEDLLRDEDVRLLDAKSQLQATALRLLRGKAAGLIEFWSNIGERESVPGAANEQLAKIGNHVVQVSNAIRRRYNLAKPNYILDDFDFKGLLERSSQKEQT